MKAECQRKQGSNIVKSNAMFASWVAQKNGPAKPKKVRLPKSTYVTHRLLEAMKQVVATEKNMQKIADEIRGEA